MIILLLLVADGSLFISSSIRYWALVIPDFFSFSVLLNIRLVCYSLVFFMDYSVLFHLSTVFALIPFYYLIQVYLCSCLVNYLFHLQHLIFMAVFRFLLAFAVLFLFSSSSIISSSFIITMLLIFISYSIIPMRYYGAIFVLHPSLSHFPLFYYCQFCPVRKFRS